MVNEQHPDAYQTVGSVKSPERIPFQIEADMRKGPPSSAVIRLHGKIGPEQSRLIDSIMRPLLKAKIQFVVVDLADVPEIEPDPVATLIRFAQERKESGMKQPCALTGLRLTVVNAIKAAKPEKVFAVYKFLHDAAKSLKLKGLPDMYVAGSRPTELNMRVMVKVVPHGSRVALVTPYGYIQEPEAKLLGKVLRRVSLMEVRNVVIDMAGISYANSHALGSLVNCALAWQKVYDRKAVALSALKPGIRLALTTLGIERTSFICDTTEEALSQLEEEERLAQAELPVTVVEEKEEPEIKPEVGEKAEQGVEEKARLIEDALETRIEEDQKKEKLPAQERIEKKENAPKARKTKKLTKARKTKRLKKADTEEKEEKKERKEKKAKKSKKPPKEEPPPQEEPEEEELTGFKILAPGKDSDTDKATDTESWLLKNVQAILKQGKKKRKEQD